MENVSHSQRGDCAMQADTGGSWNRQPASEYTSAGGCKMSQRFTYSPGVERTEAFGIHNRMIQILEYSGQKDGDSA